MFFILAEFAYVQVETNLRPCKTELKDPETAHTVSSMRI